MEQLETSTPTVKTVTPKALATKLGISPKAVRVILRTEHTREIKNKRWEIPETLAKRLIKDYKANVTEREAKNKAEIDKQLKGQQ